MTTEGLRVFTDPRSVAVVGASADPAKWGHWLARGALRGAHRRSVHLVNARSAVVDGVRSVPTLRDLPEVPELVVLCTPAPLVPAVVEEALGLGVTGFLGVTAGLDDVPGEPDLARRLADRIRAAGARLVGPNCLGLYDAEHDLELAWGRFTPGGVAIVSQSGQLGLELAGLAAHAGLGVSRFVSLGNQLDVTAVDVLDDLVDHPRTRAVVLYLESFGDGRALLASMERLRTAGTPVVVLTVGASDASRDAARSHTGALTSSVDLVAAACRRAGAVLVQTPAQAIDLAHLLLGSPLPRGRRVAVVSDSGGQGALAADSLAREGLTVPRLSPTTAGRLAALLPPGAATTNPVDLAGAGERDLGTYAALVDTLAGSGEVDSVVLSGYFGSYGQDTPELHDRELAVVESLAGTVAAHRRPVVVHAMSPDSAAVAGLRAGAVPTLHTIDGVARGLAGAAQLGEAVGSPVRPVPTGPAGPGRALPYAEALTVVSAAGLAHPGSVQVRSDAEVLAATAELRAPLVLKAGWLEHKTEVGGVVVNLTGTAAVRAAYADMVDRLGPGDYVLEEMDCREGVVELIVGVRRDPAFGPVVLVGIGGIHAEVYRDVALAVAPVSPTQAGDLIASLRGAPMLTGWRGRPAVDLSAAAGAVAALSELLVDRPDLVECEVNPLRVGVTGALAVDALVRTSRPDGEAIEPRQTLMEARP